jgi:glycosyltransferase involved in cell wall biosynthesis
MTRTPLLTALVTLGDPGQLTGGYLFHRRLAELAPAQVARLEFVSFPDRPFPLAILDARRVLAALDRLAPDVIVLDSIAIAFLSLARPLQPSVGMLHQPPGGIDYGRARTAIQGVLDRRAYRIMARVLAASESLANDLRRDPRLACRLYVVPPGRDVAPSVTPPSADLRRGRQAAFLCVGNWVQRKGILALLQAFARVDATLHLAGRTSVEPGYARRIWARLACADLQDKVVVHGPISASEVAGLYSAADAFVLPSLKEPYGTVYGEAMTFGLPVVGWRAGNLPYLAEHEREGLLVAPGDLAGLSEAMIRLAQDASLRQRLGAAARRRALARPTWDEVAEMFFGHLREVARDRHG